jgi:hypothetical protein
VCWGQVCHEVVQFCNIPGIIGNEVVEIAGSLSDGERDRVSLGVEDMGFVCLWRAYQIGCQGKEALESEGERVFESWKDGFCEIVGGLRKLIEEKALHWTAGKPWDVKESERKRCGWNRVGWWSNLALLYDRHSVGFSHR